jgi:hypothetical protein
MIFDLTQNNSGCTLTRRTVSIHSTLPRNDEEQSNGLVGEDQVLLPAQVEPAGIKSHDLWLGIWGLIVVGAILGTSIYSKYSVVGSGLAGVGSSFLTIFCRG